MVDFSAPLQASDRPDDERPGAPAAGDAVDLALELDDDIRLDVCFDSHLHFAMIASEVPVVRWVSVENASSKRFLDLRIRIGLAGELAEPWEAELPLLKAGEVWNVERVDLELAPERFLQVDTREESVLWVEMYHQDQLIVREEWPVEVLALDEWAGLSSLPEMLASFVQPAHPRAEALASEAPADLVQELESGPAPGPEAGAGAEGDVEPATPTALPEDARRAHTRVRVDAVLQAFIRRGLGVNETTGNQEERRIRNPERLFTEGVGTALDLALLLAGAFERAGLRPLIALQESGVQVGVWLSEDGFSDPAVDDGNRIARRVAQGDLQLVSLDGTAVELEGESASAWAETLLVAVDVAAARRAGIRPLPCDTDADGEADPDAWLADVSEEPERRLESWKRRLLDLSLRNRFLNYKPHRKAIPIKCPDLKTFVDGLGAGTAFEILHKSRVMTGAEGRTRAAKSAQKERDERRFLVKELGDSRLHALLDKKELERRLLDVHRTARTSVEETGANILYLAVGFLVWSDRNVPERELSAPLLLLPLALDRKSVKEGFRIRLTDGEPRVNFTLLEKLASEWKLDVGGLDELSEEEGQIDVAGFFERWRAFAQGENWRVREDLVIGLFSFTKFLMWRDLEQHSELLLSHPVIGHLVDRPETAFDLEPFPDPARLDERPPEDMLLPLDADSSQLVAVAAAEEGRSFVLEGPPGTGKSQTITNLIAHCLTKQKRVLFVAEKEAALSVVYERLSAVGLGPFCLQLYSSKGNKQEVLDQLRSSLELGRAAQPDEWRERANRLRILRDELNAYVHELHDPRELGRSVHQVIARVVGLQDARRVPLAVADPGAVRADHFAELLELLDQWRAAALAIGDPSTHPLRAVLRQDWEIDLPERIAALLEGCQRSLAELRQVSVRCARVLGFVDEVSGEVPDPSRLELEQLENAGRHLARSPRPEPELLQREAWAARGTAFQTWMEHLAAVEEARAELLQSWNDAFLRTDLEGLEKRLDAACSAKGVVRWYRLREVRKLFARFHGRQDRQLAEERMRQGIVDARAIRVREAELAAEREAFAGLLDGLEGSRADADEAASRDALQAQLAWCARFHDLLTGLAGTRPRLFGQLHRRWSALALGKVELPGDASLEQEFQGLALARRAFDEAWRAYAGALDVDEDEVLGAADARGFQDRVEAHVEGWQESYPELRDWLHWQRVRARANETMLAPIVAACDQGSLAIEDAPRAFERSFYELWLAGLLKSKGALHDFNGTEHQRKVQRFRELDEEWLELARALARSILAANIPDMGDGTPAGAEMSVLDRELRKKRKIMPIRRLFDSLPELLPKLKPCALMSPLAAAQYLEAGMQSFDLVVFDEASQIPIWDAIGAIARGKQVIVVGDSKQLPPTNFFSTIDDEEDSDEESFEELDSLLEECLASGLPTLSLRWHYRSRHESLIAFSNAHYYAHRLLTFAAPVAHSPELGVRFHHVADGVRDRGDTSTNRTEAQAMVDELVRRLKPLGKPGGRKPKPSFGLVTFSMNQQRVVEELVEKARREHPAIDPWFTDAAPEAVFIKNLESVQGDERDVIFLGVGYARDTKGRLSMNFGPLCRDGGERRLNVAITRARCQLLLFASLRAEEIDLSRTRATGARHLKAFIDYAERGPRSVAPVEWQPRSLDSVATIEEDLRERLVERGWVVDMQVGSSEFRIDLAVRHPDDPDRYVLGIECDGDGYRSTKTARDRDRLRSAVLRQLGWNLHRVWAPDWWLQPEREVEKIDELVHGLMRKEAGVPRVRLKRAEGR